MRFPQLVVLRFIGVYALTIRLVIKIIGSVMIVNYSSIPCEERSQFQILDRVRYVVAQDVYLRHIAL
jgi:hypothetical protein